MADLAAEMAKKQAANREALQKYLEGLNKLKPVEAPPKVGSPLTQTKAPTKAITDIAKAITDLYDRMLGKI